MRINQLDYWNLMASCKGNPGQPEIKTHCDHHNGDKPLSKNPSNPNDRVEESIHYLSDGSITSRDVKMNEELGTDHQSSKNGRGAMNLNFSILISNRKGALDGFTTGLRIIGKLKTQQLEGEIKKWSRQENEQLEPYAPVIV